MGIILSRNKPVIENTKMIKLKTSIEQLKSLLIYQFGLPRLFQIENMFDQNNNYLVIETLDEYPVFYLEFQFRDKDLVEIAIVFNYRGGSADISSVFYMYIDNFVRKMNEEKERR